MSSLHIRLVVLGLCGLLTTGCAPIRPGSVSSGNWMSRMFAREADASSEPEGHDEVVLYQDEPEPESTGLRKGGRIDEFDTLTEPTTNSMSTANPVRQASAERVDREDALASVSDASASPDADSSQALSELGPAFARFSEPLRMLIVKELDVASEEERREILNVWPTFPEKLVKELIRTRRSDRQRYASVSASHTELSASPKILPAGTGHTRITRPSTPQRSGHGVDAVDTPTQQALGQHPWDDRPSDAMMSPLPQGTPLRIGHLSNGPPSTMAGPSPGMGSPRPGVVPRESDPSHPAFPSQSGFDPFQPASGVGIERVNPSPLAVDPLRSRHPGQPANPHGMGTMTPVSQTGSMPPVTPSIMAESFPRAQPVPSEQRFPTRAITGELSRLATDLQREGNSAADLLPLIQRLESSVADLTIGETEEEWQRYIMQHTHLRLMYLMAGQSERAIQPIPSLTPKEQEFWQQLLWGLASYYDFANVPERENRATLAVAQLRNATRQLQTTANLEINNLSFCRDIAIFGVTEKFPTTDFSRGQLVLLYAEMENLQSEPTPEGRNWETRVRSEVEVFEAGPNGRLVKRIKFPSRRDLCQSPRRDYFHSYEFPIPEECSLGPHVLKLTVEDEVGRKVGSETIRFTVK